MMIRQIGKEHLLLSWGKLHMNKTDGGLKWIWMRAKEHSAFRPSSDTENSPSSLMTFLAIDLHGFFSELVAMFDPPEGSPMNHHKGP